MATQVKLLIQQSYRDAQLVAEEGETATSAQLNTGTLLLNRILKEISIDGWEIPLITEETLNLTTGDATLDLAGWVKLEKVQYLLGQTRFNLKLLNLNTFYNNAVIEDSQGIPYIGYPRRTPLGIELRVFLDPSENYTIFVYGYKELGTVLLTDTLNTDTISDFMADYLGYRLALDLQINAQINKISPWLLLKVEQYQVHYNRLKSLRIDQVSTKMGDDGGRETQAIVSWNLGQGWSP